MKPILLTTWPIHLDYPLFRYNVERFRKYYASIWIAFSNHYQQVDYRNFIRAQMPYAHFVDVKHEGIDWRNDAINETLNLIETDEPICFIEQDFLIKDGFFEKVFKDEYNFLYFTEGKRVHPAFAVVKRKLIEETSRNFSAMPPAGDHFSQFFEELTTTGIYIEELGVKNKEDYYHLNGLSQNYVHFTNDIPFYRAEDFLRYNFNCLSLPVETHPQFLQIEKSIEAKHGHPDHPFLDKFFP